MSQDRVRRLRCAAERDRETEKEKVKMDGNRDVNLDRISLLFCFVFLFSSLRRKFQAEAMWYCALMLRTATDK